MVIFIIGIINRIRIWAKSPMPGAITLFPAPKPGSATFWNILKESFLFPGLFRGGKGFWAMAWFFHLALALIVVGHLRVFTGFFDGIFMSLGMTEQGIAKMSATSGGAAGVIIMAAAILLILRRMSINRVREISNPADYLALLLTNTPVFRIRFYQKLRG